MYKEREREREITHMYIYIYICIYIYIHIVYIYIYTATNAVVTGKTGLGATQLDPTPVIILNTIKLDSLNVTIYQIHTHTHTSGLFTAV